jgi:hypothetical protein
MNIMKKMHIKMISNKRMKRKIINRKIHHINSWRSMAKRARKMMRKSWNLLHNNVQKCLLSLYSALSLSSVWKN